MLCFLSPEPCYDSVTEDEDASSGRAAGRLSLPASIKGLKLKPAAWVSATKHTSGGRGSGPGHAPNSEVSLIDFGEEFPPGCSSSPSPVAEIPVPSLAKLALEGDNLLDRTPPQSPSRALPRPLHPTPVVDWNARPLPPPPAYDDVAQDDDDMEVRVGGGGGGRRGCRRWGGGGCRVKGIKHFDIVKICLLVMYNTPQVLFLTVLCNLSLC